VALDVPTMANPPQLRPEHFGKWVAVRGVKVVAYAVDYDELAADPRVRPEDDVFFVSESTP
jgi:hypothetical protein